MFLFFTPVLDEHLSSAYHESFACEGFSYITSANTFVGGHPNLCPPAVSQTTLLSPHNVLHTGNFFKARMPSAYSVLMATGQSSQLVNACGLQESLFCTSLFPKHFENIASPKTLFFLRLSSWLLKSPQYLLNLLYMYQNIVILICRSKSVFHFLSWKLSYKK